MEGQKDWRETRRSDGAWTEFLLEAINKIVYVETRLYATPQTHMMNYPMPKYPLRLMDFDDQNIVCIGEDRRHSQIFSRKDIVSITCQEGVKRIPVSPEVLGELRTAMVTGKRIQFIKTLREAMGTGLKEAKDLADVVWESNVDAYFEEA